MKDTVLSLNTVRDIILTLKPGADVVVITHASPADFGIGGPCVAVKNPGTFVLLKCMEMRRIAVIFGDDMYHQDVNVLSTEGIATFVKMVNGASQTCVVCKKTLTSNDSHFICPPCGSVRCSIDEWNGLMCKACGDNNGECLRRTCLVAVVTDADGGAISQEDPVEFRDGKVQSDVIAGDLGSMDQQLNLLEHTEGCTLLCPCGQIGRSLCTRCHGARYCSKKCQVEGKASNLRFFLFSSATTI
jgi:predicted RNA-binding Zn-ribbon protein involved in translation (DUF1610 family)